MHQKRNKKILLLFFLFLLIGTLNNKNLEFNNFGKINEIIVTGLEENYNIELMKELNFLKLENLFFLDKKEIKKILNKNNYIEEYFVIKKYPSTLNIKIDKAVF